jgi:membrane associated rhomboid family serine protease
MLFPIKHENMSARRWPVITIGLIVLNCMVFLVTHSAIQRQEAALAPLRVQLIVLAARHPELNIQPDVQQFVSDFRASRPKTWDAIESSPQLNAWDAQLRSTHDASQMQEEMNSLAAQYSKLASASIVQRFAFIPAHPKPLAYLTSIFLHGGWMHLIGNMWFLWLAGFVLEDVWGRPLYLLFYLAAGVAATQLDGWANPGSVVPTLGASGAIAGLMGAFLVRFPKLRVRMMWFFDFGLTRWGSFWMRAYWLLPLWLGLEIYYGKVFGQNDGIAHSAHIGGFIFGAAMAWAVRRSGFEHSANKAIEDKISWSDDPEIATATELVDQKKFDKAVPLLKAYLAKKPGSFAAWNLLHLAHWRRNEIEPCREALVHMCELNLKSGMDEEAWQNYRDFLNLGGEAMPPAVCMQLCRSREKQKDFQWAFDEYEKLAAAHPAERAGLLARLAAARLLLKHLNRPHDAFKRYEAVSASSVPHLDLEPEILLGIQQSKSASLQSSSIIN